MNLIDQFIPPNQQSGKKSKPNIDQRKASQLI